MKKKLYRSTTDRKLAGVCGGLAKYLNVDATLIRIIWALAWLAGGVGLLLYIVCAFVIPDEPSDIIDAAE